MIKIDLAQEHPAIRDELLNMIGSELDAIRCPMSTLPETEEEALAYWNLFLIKLRRQIHETAPEEPAATIAPLTAA